MSIDKSKLELACIQLPVDALEPNEYAFLCEYYGVMSLVAGAMNTLEADRYTFGIYLPTLLGLQYQLRNVIEQLRNQSSRQYSIEIIDELGEMNMVSSNCLPLAYAVKRGFDNRFGDLIDPYNVKSVPLYVAMLSNPMFKLNFMCLPSISEELFTHLKEMLVNAAVIAYEDENGEQRPDDKRSDDNGNSIIGALRSGKSSDCSECVS